MKLKHYFMAVLLLGSINLSAQTNEVQEWSNAHPAVLFVASNDATTEYLENLKTNNIDYIVFDQEVTLSDITAFEAKNGLNEIAEFEESIQIEIKTWLAKHRNIKVIKRSTYNQMDASKQAIYQESRALILIGEEITLEDIYSYE